LTLTFALHAPQYLEKIALLNPAASFISLNTFFRAVAASVMRVRARPVLKASLYSWVTLGFQIDPIYTQQFILGFFAKDNHRVEIGGFVI
jgi:hypothetical protein